jgi:hypothetical protein
MMGFYSGIVSVKFYIIIIRRRYLVSDDPSIMCQSPLFIPKWWSTSRQAHYTGASTAMDPEFSKTFLFTDPRFMHTAVLPNACPVSGARGSEYRIDRPADIQSQA